MPRVEKGKYPDRQERQAEHVDTAYVEHCLPEDEAERLAWAEVNDVHPGGEKPESRKSRLR